MIPLFYQTKRQRRGGLTNDQLWMLSVAGGYARKSREIMAKKRGVITCRHQKKAANRFPLSVPVVTQPDQTESTL